MQKDYIYVPKAKGTSKPDKVEIFIGLFTPGKENAIKRNDLTQRCVDAGLINPDAVDKDRSMRNLLKRAKVDYNIKITNDARGEGYYIPTPKESMQLARNNRREKKKSISTYRNNIGNEALEADYKAERII